MSVADKATLESHPSKIRSLQNIFMNSKSISNFRKTRHKVKEDFTIHIIWVRDRRSIKTFEYISALYIDKGKSEIKRINTLLFLNQPNVTKISPSMTKLCLNWKLTRKLYI